MASRLDLQTTLEKLLGSRNVYFQPPSSIKMKYPAIVYSINRFDIKHASNKIYKSDKSYVLTYIDDDPDNETVDKILQLPMCRFDRSFVSDNLNHYTFTLYF